MEDFLIALLQGVFEFILEIISNVPFDLPSWSRTTPESETIAGRCFVAFVIGCGLAGITMLCLKHTWIPTSTLRIANLVLAPLTSAVISGTLARWRSRSNPNIIPRNHFWQAFWFTLGVVIVRFAYAARG